MAKEFSDPKFFGSHRLSVDAYMAQHPYKKSRASIQSVWVHLVGLCLVLERNAQAKYVGQFMAALTHPKRDFEWLEPPSFKGTVNASDVEKAKDVAEHRDLTRRWAESVWKEWAQHHDKITNLIDSVRPT